MITLLTGKKGSGKTKKLIDLANAAVEKSNGNVVVVEKGLKLTYDISHAARLIDIDAYDVQGGKGLYGFLAGALVMAVRHAGAYEQGACFAILIANAFTPVFDQWVLYIRMKGRRLP